MLPDREEFPYAIRQVSEALGSNGSTSMGSVCASTLSLLNAGVPLKAPVAGIAMGLVSDEVDGKTEYVALTDILGAEDAFGDMDFKVAGTKEFVTALQLDTKLDGIPSEVLAAALTQARDARLHILDVMAEAIDGPDEMSPYAPRVTTVKIPVDKIGEVIGPKGKMINSIQDETGADITIEDDGTIYVGAADGPSAQAAVDRINAIANPQLPKVGERFLGTVVKTAAFGAFVSLLPGKDGLVHISKLGNGKRIGKVEDVVKVGDKLQVEITDIDSRGKISLIPVAEDDAAGGDAGPAEAAGIAGDVTQADQPRPGPGWALRRPPRSRRARRSVLDLDGLGGGWSAPCCPAGCGWSPRRCPASARPRSGIWVGVGSRDETPALAGASHFLEHLLFKGTRIRTALEIADGVRRGRRRAERVHREGAHLLLRARARQRPADGGRAARATWSPTRSSPRRTWRPSARWSSRRSPCATTTRPTPVHDLFGEALFGDTPLGRPVIGHVESIESLTRDASTATTAAATPAVIMVAAAGAVDHAAVVELVRAAFGGRLPGRPPGSAAAAGRVPPGRPARPAGLISPRAPSRPT